MITIHIPPQRPLYVICGTSHVKNLARISHTDYDDVKVHSDRTAYVVMNTGSAAGFQFWGQLILATVTRELLTSLPSFTPETFHPVLLLMSPFPWNLGYRNDVYYVNEKKFETPWEKTTSLNIMKATEMIVAHISGNPAINMALAWMDHPILPKQQVRSFRLNKIVKEVNYLLDPNLPSCRSWRTSLTSVRNGDSEPLEVTSMSHLYFNTNMYGDGEGKDNSHLADPGSSAFLLSIWTGFGQGLRDRNAALDFSQCRPVISTPPYLQTSYFMEVQDLRESVANDSTCVENIMALDSLSNYTIDVNSLNMNIRHQVNRGFINPPKFNSNANGSLSDKADRRVKKAAIYNKNREMLATRAGYGQSSNTNGHGTGKW